MINDFDKVHAGLLAFRMGLCAGVWMVFSFFFFMLLLLLYCVTLLPYTEFAF